MESLNHTLFLWLNAPEHPNAWVLALAIFFAKHLIWAVPLAISIGWLRGHEGTRKAMLVATAAGVLGLLINQAIGLAWSHPRPFMIGLGHTLIPHAADSSFPSDHLTLWWALRSVSCSSEDNAAEASGWPWRAFPSPGRASILACTSRSTCSGQSRSPQSAPGLRCVRSAGTWSQVTSSPPPFIIDFSAS